MYIESKSIHIAKMRNGNIVLNFSDMCHYLITIIVVLFQSRYIQILPFHTTFSSAYTIISRMIAFLIFAWYLCVFIVNNNNKHAKIEPVIVIAILYYVFLFFSTFLMSTGNYRRVGMQAYPIISLVLFTEYQVKHRPKVFLHSTALILTALNICNIYLMFFDPYRFGTNTYFLGNKNGLLTGMLVGYVFVMLYINLYTHITKYQKNIIRITCFIIISLALIKAWSATDLVAWFIVIVIHFVPYSALKLNWIKYYFIAWMSLVVFRIQNLFENIIVGILHKSLTLTYRTKIWDQALDGIKDNLLFGHGVGESGNLFYIHELYTTGFLSAHNELLQILYEGGLVCAVLFILVPYISIKTMKDSRLLECIIAIVGCLISCLCEAPGPDVIFFLSVTGISISKYVIKD